MRVIVLLLLIIFALAVNGCVREQPEVIVITATLSSPVVGVPTATLDPLLPTPTMLVNAPVDTTEIAAALPGRYVVQPGDTLSLIAASQGVSVTALVEANNIADPNRLEVGQVLVIPNTPSQIGSDFRILPDSRLVRAPGSAEFDIRGFIAAQPGFIRTVTDTVDDVVLGAADIVERVAFEYSVDPRLLLALLEMRANWLSNPAPDEFRQVYPLGAPASPLGFDRNGLFRQLAWGADQLNFGYYRHKYANLRLMEFPDEGVAIRFAEGVNHGTAGVQWMLSLFNRYDVWQLETGALGLNAIYQRYFGDPFANALDPLIPLGLEQPLLTFPFPAGETWYFTGGPHGGWGSGSAWAAVDFAPPDDLTTVTSACYVSEYYVTAIAPGVIARTAEGVVVLDLDGDGDEATGWSILYLHIATQDRVAAGTVVNIGDRIGRPSCEGGFSTGTHLHIARRYNGEWLPADCTICPVELRVPNFVMSDWTFYGYTQQEYQGYALKGSEERVAEQGRNNPLNQVNWTR
ncbi:MAG: LysM peptidoglycan-binding domain-containing protein [Chloroflexota bacterium]|nr:LysM peptidoglycan-binding domain-containing protein [Chloroflexota bacterium]